MKASHLLFLGALFSLSVSAQENDTAVLHSPNHNHRTYGIYEHDFLPAAFHRERREALRAMLPDNSAAVLFANPVRNRSNDVDFEYHQDPNFYYLTGLVEPHAVVVIFKDKQKINGKKTDEIIFVQDRNPAAEVWVGKRLGKEGVEEVLQFENVLINSNFQKTELKYDKLDKIYVLAPQDDMRDNPRDKGDLASMVEHFTTATNELSVNRSKLRYWLGSLREVKQQEELELLAKAITLTCEGHKELMRALEPGMHEYQTEAIVEYHFKHGGAEYTGFPSICGGGENGTILHYVTNRRPLEGKDMLVVDIGAEYHGYSADVARTLPVDGKFSTEEKAIYDLVYEAQQAGIEACKKGNSFSAPDIAATQILIKGLRELGIIEKDNEIRKYFMHGTSHYLGLDVHDPGTYSALKPGNVITVEPGIYITEGSDCDPKWWNIGVRIEDDILITEGDPVNLSGSLPSKSEEVEKLMQETSHFNTPSDK